MEPRTVCYGFLSVFFVCTMAMAQPDAASQKQQKIIYTIVYNKVPDQFRFPLIGLVNVSNGNHSGVQVGLTNSTTGNFRGFQNGLVNMVKGTCAGLQVGIVNTGLENTNGFQAGLVNTTSKRFKGFQLGVLNVTRQEVRGLQVGLINIADTVSRGIPVGLLTVVKKGAYRSFELSVNEMYPFNIAFKIGIPRFYSIIQVAYNQSYREPLAVGLGLGSLVSLRPRLYFNPEVLTLSSFASENNFFGKCICCKHSVQPECEISGGCRSFCKCD